MEINDFSMDFFSLKGKVAIVTGGNTGLGQAYAMAMAKAGAHVFIPAFAMDQGETKALIEAQGVEVDFMQIDLTTKGAPKKVVDACIKRFGKIDILINNAGICKLNPVLKFGREDWDPMMDINITVPFELTHEVIQHMIPQQSGKIINIGSLYSYRGGQTSPAYSASKHAMAGLTKAYADELGQYNIQVNAIAPGYYATALTTVTRSNPKLNQAVLERIPANRWGDTMDLMGATVFLASRASDYVNGEMLAVDGGFLVR